MNLKDIEKLVTEDVYESMFESLLDSPSYGLVEMVLEGMSKKELLTWAKEIKEEWGEE